MVFWNIVVSVILNVVAYAIMPKPQRDDPEPADEVEFPSIDEGKPIPVIFGTMEISPFIAWYGDFDTEPIRERQGKK